MYNCKILNAFLCICLSIQVFCGDEHDHNHDHHEDHPHPQVPVIFPHPGVFPVVATQNPYVFVPHEGNGNYHSPNVVKFQQRNPGDAQAQNSPNGNGQYGNNDHDRYPNNGNSDHQKDTQIYNKNDQLSYQLSAAFPEGCDFPGRDSRYCKMTVKITPNKNQPNYYTFELTGKSDGYIAVGLSEDLLMGDDHIVECIRKKDGRFEHYQSFSKIREMPERIRDDPSIVNNFYYKYKDGNMSCSFDRFWNTYIQHNNNKYVYNLKEGKHHVLLAMGRLKDTVKGDEIGYHGKDERFATPKYIYEMKRSPYYYNRNGSISINSFSSILLTVSVIYTMYAYITS